MQTGVGMAEYRALHGPFETLDVVTYSQANDIATTENSYTLNATLGQSHQTRVAGVDAENRQGPFSNASDPYMPDAGAPGQPGKPILF